MAPPGEKCTSRDWRIIKTESSGSDSNIQTSNSFLIQWKTERPPGWQIGICGSGEMRTLGTLGWFPELVLEEVCLTCLVLSPPKVVSGRHLAGRAPGRNTGIYHHDQGGQWLGLNKAGLLTGWDLITNYFSSVVTTSDKTSGSTSTDPTLGTTITLCYPHHHHHHHHHHIKTTTGKLHNTHHT